MYNHIRINTDEMNVYFVRKVTIHCDQRGKRRHVYFRDNVSLSEISQDNILSYMNFRYSTVLITARKCLVCERVALKH